MRLSRRDSMQLALTGLVLASIPGIAMAVQTYETEGGTVTIQPVEHASFYLIVPGHVIAVDPVGPATLYEGLPAPDVILITHEHGDHFDVATLAGLVANQPQIVTNPAVFEQLPDDLKALAAPIANGETRTLDTLGIEAVPAYNITEDRLQYHPKGRDNGYVLTIGGKRFYIAGDTEATDEMKALQNIDVAFVPMNLPYTMTAEQAAEGVAAFAPAMVYPYHHRGTDPAAFVQALKDIGATTEVVIADWYPGVDDPTGAAPE